VLVVLGVSRPTLAHRDDYINETFVFQTLEAREFEPELFLDLGHVSGSGESLRRYSAAFEYGITPHWMVDGFVGWLDPEEGSTALQRVRTETRFRFGEEGDRPVDLAASFEVEYEKETEAPEGPLAPAGKHSKSYVLTPRLVLSRDVGDVNLTLNLDLARELREHVRDRWTPGYAIGARYPREALFRYGVELRMDFGDERRSLVVPQVWVALPKETTLKIGGGRELEGSPRETFLRLILEREF